MLPYKFWLIFMGMKQLRIGGLKKTEFFKSTYFPFSILKQFLKFRAYKSENNKNYSTFKVQVV